MKRGFSRFWYRFKNWFRTKPGPGEPLTFLCGSEEELRRVTTWICHANPLLFQNSIPIVAYYAAYEGQSAYSALVGPSGMHPYIVADLLLTPEYEAINALCSLAIQHNQFEGTEWIDTSPHYFWLCSVPVLFAYVGAYK